jgi:micrococcal nuclease
VNLHYYRIKPTQFGEPMFVIIDGDTLDVTLDLGAKVSTDMRVRLYGINTPESHDRTPEPELAKGLAAKEFLQETLYSTRISLNASLIVETHKIRHRTGEIGERRGKYGRYLVSLWLRSPDGTLIDVNRAMVANGHANFYGGGKRPELGTWQWLGEEQLG